MGSRKTSSGLFHLNSLFVTPLNRADYEGSIQITHNFGQEFGDPVATTIIWDFLLPASQNHAKWSKF
jgi:hypothetical protein